MAAHDVTSGPFLNSPCGVRQALIDVLAFEVRVSLEDLVTGSPGSKQAQHHADSDTLPTNAGLSAHHRGIESDAIELWHWVSYKFSSSKNSVSADEFNQPQGASPGSDRSYWSSTTAASALRLRPHGH